MKIDRRWVTRTGGAIICFIIVYLVINYIMTHLPAIIRSFKKL